jgi:transcriptional regulator with XRE-family HTH domain
VSQEQEAPTVAEVVARNVRRLRGTHTADELARKARGRGLNWGTGRISELEAGKVSPTLPTLFALAEALGSIAGTPVSLADLVRADGFIKINDKLVVKAKKVVASVSSVPVELTVGDLEGGKDRLADVLRGAMAEMNALPDYLLDMPGDADDLAYRNSGETEERIAKSLGIGILRMRLESTHLWGDAFSAERDRRAGPDANAQKRGRVSRELKAELKASIHRGND